MEVFQTQDPTLSCPKTLVSMRTPPDEGEQPSSQSWGAVSKLCSLWAQISCFPDSALRKNRGGCSSHQGLRVARWLGDVYGAGMDKKNPSFLGHDHMSRCGFGVLTCLTWFSWGFHSNTRTKTSCKAFVPSPGG